MIGTKAVRPRGYGKWPGSCLSLIDVPEPRMRRVSKQFKDEYNEELALRGPVISLRMTRNIWSRHDGIWDDVACPIFTAFADEVESIELHFDGEPEDDYTNTSVQYLQEDVDKLMAELPKLKRIKFTATMRMKDWADAHAWYSSEDMLSYFDFNNLKDPKHAGLTIECELHLWSPLFSLVTPTRYYEGTASAEWCTARTYGTIYYVGRPAPRDQPRGYSYYGLDLQTMERAYSPVYVDRALKRALKQQQEKTRWLA